MVLHASTGSVRLEQMFADQAARTPQAPAVFHQGGVRRYAELAEDVERLARDLRRQGVGPGVVVALNLSRTPRLITAVLAVLSAGGAFLPLEGRNPPDRLSFMLADSGAAVMLVDEAAAEVDFNGSVLELDSRAALQRRYAGSPRASAPGETAYVIYTSGSSGRPKGVVLGHGARHLIDWARRAYAPEDLARVAAATSLSFDPSILEIFAPLCSGGALILKQNALEPFGGDERPTLMATAPSVLAQLCRADAVPRSLRVLISGGEALTGPLARQVLESRPGVRLENHYGPTEATTCVSVARISPGLAGEPSIGRPVRGARLRVLGADGAAIEDGMTGELHIGGPGLALGYLNRPELTAERFIVRNGERLYRTGDLVFARDGEFHFTGRRDRQVKVRGFRIELGEIEAAMRTAPGVEDAAVVTRDAAGRTQIIAYLEGGRSLSEEKARAHLIARLPDYMIPARIVVLDALPRLASGKLDVGALPAPVADARSALETLTRLERPIVHVFQEVLGRTAVGSRQSFFDLGGDSLASVQAALRLSEILGHEVPPGLIHQAPTAQGLARALEHGKVRADRCINLIEAGRPAAPLFCMADLFGHAFNYLSLARRLGGDRAIYGVTPGPLQAAFTRSGDLAALTQGFVDELRALRPNGPYLIAGYSAGGLLAMDLARALERDGQAVQLILLDSYLHAGRPGAGSMVRMGASLIGTALGGGLASGWAPPFQAAFAARMVRAGLGYEPAPLRGPALLIAATEREAIDIAADRDGKLGWGAALSGPIVRAQVIGDHHQFLREPRVEETATLVKRFLLAHE